MRFLLAILLAAVLAAGSHAQAPITPPGPPLVVTPPVPQPTPVTPAVVPMPDDLSPQFTIVASIGGEVIGDEVVTLPVGRLLTLTVQGVPGESAAAITWAMNDKSADLSIRESGHYLTFTAPVQGNWLFTAAANNPDALLGPLVAQRWVKVGHGPQPPPDVVPDPPGPTPVPPEPAPTPTDTIKHAYFVFIDSWTERANDADLMSLGPEAKAWASIRAAGHTVVNFDVESKAARESYGGYLERAPVLLVFDRDRSDAFVTSQHVGNLAELRAFVKQATGTVVP